MFIRLRFIAIYIIYLKFIHLIFQSTYLIIFIFIIFDDVLVIFELGSRYYRSRIFNNNIFRGNFKD